MHEYRYWYRILPIGSTRCCLTLRTPIAKENFDFRKTCFWRLHQMDNISFLSHLSALIRLSQAKSYLNPTGRRSCVRLGNNHSILLVFFLSKISGWIGSYCIFFVYFFKSFISITEHWSIKDIFSFFLDGPLQSSEELHNSPLIEGPVIVNDKQVEGQASTLNEVAHLIQAPIILTDTFWHCRDEPQLL